AGTRTPAADHLEDVLHRKVAALVTARQDRAAVDEDRWHVEPQHRHHHARQALVASGEADDRVVAVAADRQLDRIRDHLAADEARTHALVAHGDTVGHGDRVEPPRGTSALLHALAADVGLEVERGIARRAVVAGRNDGDERPRDLVLRHAHRVVIAALRCLFGADRNVTAGQAGLVETVGHRGSTGMDVTWPAPSLGWRRGSRIAFADRSAGARARAPRRSRSVPAARPRPPALPLLRSGLAGPRRRGRDAPPPRHAGSWSR